MWHRRAQSRRCLIPRKRPPSPREPHFHAQPVAMKTAWKPGPVADAPRVFVVATRLVWKRFRDLPEVLFTGLHFRSLWNDLEGAVGVQTGSLLLRRTILSISVWESESAFQAFMRHPWHQELMERHRTRLSGSRSESWWTEDFDLRSAWKEGDRALTDDQR